MFLEGGGLRACVREVLLSQGLPDLIGLLLSWIGSSHDGRHDVGSCLGMCELGWDVPCLGLIRLPSFFICISVVIEGDGDVWESSPAGGSWEAGVWYGMCIDWCMELVVVVFLECGGL